MTTPPPAKTVLPHAFKPVVPQSDVCTCGLPSEPHAEVHDRTEDEE